MGGLEIQIPLHQPRYSDLVDLGWSPGIWIFSKYNPGDSDKSDRRSTSPGKDLLRKDCTFYKLFILIKCLACLKLDSLQNKEAIRNICTKKPKTEKYLDFKELLQRKF